MEGKAKYEVAVLRNGWRQHRKQIEEDLHIVHTETWQDKPWTAVKVVAMWQNQEFMAHGFTKVRWPDQWDPGKGVELATAKAVGKIVKMIAERHFGYGEVTA